MSTTRYESIAHELETHPDFKEVREAGRAFDALSADGLAVRSMSGEVTDGCVSCSG